MRKLVLTLVAALSALTLVVWPAQAEEVGNSAVVLTDTSLFSGPGVRYPEAGTVAASQAVTVVRCSNRWCLLADENGWLSIDDVSFGNFERRPFHGTVYDWGHGGPGEVCLHEGANFSGASVCLTSGTVSRDLVLLGWDNRISSVSINGNVSVNLCRDRDFASYCEKIVESQASMNRLLNNSASSFQVW